MYQLLKTVYPDGDLEQTVKLPALDDSPKGTSYEYDFTVRHSRTRQIIFFEVKGYRSESVIEKGDYDTKNTLKWFFGRTFPSGRKHYEKEINNSYKVRSVFITSAKFNQEGTLFLAALNNGDQKPLEMDVSYNGTELLKLVEQKRLTLLKSTLERYFFKTKNR